jgi:dTDP-4-amino-4,6-dideoxygalactose transaminase
MKINVTKTFLPKQEEYNKILERVWRSKWITNRGILVLELEDKLKEYLNVSNILITNNGTIPLQLALNLLGKKGEVITTPFSYIATTSAIIWENCTPIFVDIHPEYLTIDERKIENAITNETTAILATHVFGNPCNVQVIESIAKKYNLKVIYDGAHAFGVSYKEKSIFEYGDVSTCSFHATKLFHTGEGGALFANNTDLYHQLFYSHNFGHNGLINFYGLGINAKISELQAAMGLAIFPYINYIRTERNRIVDYYNTNLDFSKIQSLKIREETNWNFSYYPIIFESEYKLLRIQKMLNKKHIFPRRYFYPSLNTIEFINTKRMPISEDIASRILCLPIYHDLTTKDLNLIIETINKNL